MIIQYHVEEIMFAISDLGNTDVYIGHEWLKKHNPDIDWEKSCIFMTRCKPSCQFIDHFDFIDDDNTETLIDEEDSPLEEGDRLFFFNVDSFIDDNHLEINRNNYHDHNNNKNISWNNYNYILKHNPKIGEPKDWENVVPKHYHDYHDIFTKKEFDKLPERWSWDHAIELDPNFKPINCKTYSLSPEEQWQLKLFIEENLLTGRIQPSKSPTFGSKKATNGKPHSVPTSESLNRP